MIVVSVSEDINGNQMKCCSMLTSMLAREQHRNSASYIMKQDVYCYYLCSFGFCSWAILVVVI